MAYTDEYAILQEIDKCVKCRACTVACERVNELDNILPGAEKIQSDDWVVVKPQKSVDNPPFVRYSCWHCQNPPCAVQSWSPSTPEGGCPFKAVKVFTSGQTAGSVYIDTSLCNPGDPKCTRQCAKLCRRGGYPKIGNASSKWGGDKAGKCDLCYDWIAAQTDNKLKKPACVLTCPMGALTYDTVTNIKAKFGAGKEYPTYFMGDGHIFWASKKGTFNTPNTDPFIEDHISPMFSRWLASPAGKMLALPGVIFGALYALYRRRTELASVKKA